MFKFNPFTGKFDQVGAGGGGSSPLPVFYDLGSISGAISLNYNNGKWQKGSLTGNVTINPPSNGFEGATIKFHLTASGANRNLSFNASILIPSESSFTSPKTLNSGELYIVQIEHNGTNWMLTTLVGGYN